MAGKKRELDTGVLAEPRWMDMVEGRELEISAVRVCSRLPSEEQILALELRPFPRKKRYSRGVPESRGFVMAEYGGSWASSALDMFMITVLCGV